MAEAEEKVVLITGCTVGGIGHALAVAFARRGCRVVATSRMLRSMEGLDRHPRLHLLELDVLSDDSVENAVQNVVEEYGRIDIVVNNAGVQCVAPLLELPLPLLEKTFSTNVYGAMRVIKAVVPHMVNCGKDKVVNIGSVTALAPAPWVGAYAASKAALHALSDSLRVELKPFGIDVMTVAPGAIKSNIGANSSVIYKSLPEFRLYKPFEKAIYERVMFSQQSRCTSADAFANKTVETILQNKTSAWFSYGQFSIVSAVLYYLPLWLRDIIMRKAFRVSNIKDAKQE